MSSSSSSPRLCSVKRILLLASATLLLMGPSGSSDPVPPNSAAPALTLETRQGPGFVTLLCRAPEGHTGVLFELHRGRELVDSMAFQQERREASFHVRDRGTRELYCCMYHDRHRRHSGYSPYLTLGGDELLPAPRLSVVAPDPGDEVVTLECSGLQSYPGVEFTLFHLGSYDPVTSRHALATHSTVRFTLPTRQPRPGPYQCQYSVLLGQERRDSERSHPLTVPELTGTDVMTDGVPPPSPPSEAPDWPLVAGCVSAVLLFLVVLSGLGVAIHRRVRALAENRKKREEARFWKHLHSMDRVLDQTLRHGSIGSLEWGDSSTARVRSSSLSSPPCPLSTFENPAVS